MWMLIGDEDDREEGGGRGGRPDFSLSGKYIYIHTLFIRTLESSVFSSVKTIHTVLLPVCVFTYIHTYIHQSLSHRRHDASHPYLLTFLPLDQDSITTKETKLFHLGSTESND